MSRCCHVYNLMNDVGTAMLHYLYLEISTEYVWCSENLNMQFSGASDSSGKHRYICILLTYVTKTK